MPDVITTIDPADLALRFQGQTLPRQSRTTAGQSIRDFLIRLTLQLAWTTQDTTTVFAALDRKRVDSVFTELDALLQVDNANGYTFRASPDAHANARRYLQSIRFVMESKPYLFVPSVIPDGEGGIDIEWENGLRRVAISCRAEGDQKDCIYWREIGSGDYQARDVTPEWLHDRLKWLART